MSLVERGDQAELLETWFAEADQGYGRVVALRGEVGLGKTTLLHTLARHATGAGALFLGAVGSRSEQGIPLGVIGQLFDDPALRAAELLSNRPDLNGAEAAALRDLGTILLSFTRDRMVLIGIDDVEYADEASLRCLLLLARRIRAARMMIVLSGRPMVMVDVELLRQSQSNRVSLAPLSKAGVHQILAERGGAWLTEAFGCEVHRVTGGNPLLVHALVEDHLAYRDTVPDSAVVATAEVGDAFRQAVLSCLYRLEPEVLRLVRAAVVLDLPFSAPQLGRLAGVATQSVMSIVDTLNKMGLLDSGEFRHPATRAAVLGAITGADRADVHRHAAQVLHEDGAAVSAIAEHLLAADYAGAPWVIDELTQAAEQALVSGQAGQAVRYLRLAATAETDRQQQTNVIALLARAEWRLDPAVASRHVSYLVAALRDGYLRGRYAFIPIRHLLWQGKVTEALDTLEELTEHAENIDPETRAELRSTQLWVAASYPPFGSYDAENRRTTPNADGQPLVTVLNRRSDQVSVEAAQQILQRERLDDATLGPMVAALVALMYAGRMDEADACCVTLMEEADARAAQTWQALFSGIRSEIAVRRGDMLAAQDYARAALAYLPVESWGVAVGRPLGSLVLAVTSMGRYDEAAELLSLPIPNVMFNTRFGLHYLFARGHYYLATGRPSAALGNFNTCGDLMAEWGLDQPAVVPWRTGASLAWLQLGDREQAKRLAEQQLSMVSDGELRTYGISLRLLAVTSPLKERVPLLTDAVTALQKHGDQLELARTLADLGRVHGALGDPRRAAMISRQVRQLAEACHAAPLVAEAVRDIRLAESRMGADQPGGVDGLSEAELRVAALAADGHPNREIARQLSITASTVEQHLTRIYRKLKVRRRWDLPEKLAR